jgi:hypothetical protein
VCHVKLTVRESLQLCVARMKDGKRGYDDCYSSLVTIARCFELYLMHVLYIKLKNQYTLEENLL